MKGFIYSLSTLVLLITLIIVLTYYDEYMKLQQEVHISSLKALSLSSFSVFFSDKTTTELAKETIKLSLYRLALFTADCPLKDEGYRSESEYEQALAEVLNEYFSTGFINESHFVCRQPFREELEVNEILSKFLKHRGFQLEAWQIHINQLGQYNASHLYINASVYINITDLKGETGITLHREVNFLLPVDGLPDPLASSLSSVANATIIYVHPFPAPKKLSYTVEAAQGWFYGPLVKASDVRDGRVYVYYPELYILVGTFDDIKSVHNYDKYGAYIITNSIRTISSCHPGGDEYEVFNARRCHEEEYLDQQGNIQTRCVCEVAEKTEKPFVVAPDFTMPEDSSTLDDLGGRAVLLISAVNPEDVTSNPELKTDLLDKAGIYGMEDVRDVLACGYYFPSEEAPSFLERFFENRATLKSEHGIFTFLVEREYGNDLQLSTVDFERAQEREARYVIRGGISCKNKQMCSELKEDQPLRVSYWGINLPLGDVSCEVGQHFCTN